MRGLLVFVVLSDKATLEEMTEEHLQNEFQCLGEGDANPSPSRRQSRSIL